MNDTAAPRLMLVHSRKREPVRSSSFTLEEIGPQSSFFALPKPGVVVFVQFADIGDTDFVDLLNLAGPAWIFDMRFAPRFDIGSLNRRKAFDLFDRTGATYVDVTAPLMSGLDRVSARDAALRRLTDLCHSGKLNLARPVVFLLARGNSIASDSEILNLLSASGLQAAEIVPVPAITLTRELLQG